LEVFLDLVPALFSFFVETLAFCLGIIGDRLRLGPCLLQNFGVLGFHFLAAIGELREQLLVSCTHRTGRSEEHTSELQSRFDHLVLLSFPTRRSSDLSRSLPRPCSCVVQLLRRDARVLPWHHRRSSSPRSVPVAEFRCARLPFPCGDRRAPRAAPRIVHASNWQIGRAHV